MVFIDRSPRHCLLENLETQLDRSGQNYPIFDRKRSTVAIF